MGTLFKRILKGLVIGGLAFAVLVPASAYGWLPSDQKVSINDIYISRSSSIAVDPQKNAYIAWVDWRSGNPDIYYRRINSTLTMSPEVIVTNNTSSQQSPSIAVDALGNKHIVWTDYRNGNADIYYKKIWANNTSKEVQVTNHSSAQYEPTVVASSDGSAYIAWTDRRNGNFDIYFAKTKSNGDVDNETRVTNNTFDQLNPSLAIDSTGNKYLVWHDYRNGSDNADIYYRKLNPNNNVVGTADIQITGYAGNQFNPSIAVDSMGIKHIVWQDQRGGVGTNAAIYYKYLNADESLGLERPITNDLSDHASPRIVADSSNRLHVVWYDNRNGNNDIYYKILDSGGNRIIEDYQITTITNNDYSPAVAVDSDRCAHIAWPSDRDGHDESYYQKNNFDNVNPTVANSLEAYHGPNKWTPAAINGAANDVGTGVNCVDVAIYNTDTGYYWNGLSWTWPATFFPATFEPTSKTWYYSPSLAVFSNDSHLIIYGRSADNAGNQSDLVGMHLYWDSLAPSTEVNDFPPYQTSSNAFTVSWGGIDAGNHASGIATYEVQYRDNLDVDWTTWIARKTPTSETFTIGEHGHTYYFRCKAVDNVNNAEIYPTSPDDYDTFTTIDTVSPESTINMVKYYGPDTWNIPSPSINGVSTDETSGVDKVKIRIKRTDPSGKNYWKNNEGWDSDDNTWVKGTLTGGPKTVAWTYGNLTAESLTDTYVYTIEAVVIDNAGNQESPTKLHTFKYDRYPPHAFIDSTYFAPYYKQGDTVSVSGEAWDETGDASFDLSYESVNDPAGKGSIVSGTADKTRIAKIIGSKSATDLASDKYMIILTVTAPNGNFRTATAGPITVDMKSPTSTIESIEGPQGDAGWYTNDVKITLRADDNIGGSGILSTSYHYKLDGVQTDGQNIINIGEGTHVLEYWAIDVAGNEELPHTTTSNFKVDKTAPLPPVITYPTADPTYSTGANSVILRGDTTADNLSGLKDVYVQLKDTANTYKATLSGNQWESEPIDISTWGENSYVLQVYEKDEAGNTGSPDELLLVVDRNGPNVTINNIPSPTGNTTITLTGTTKDTGDTVRVLVGTEWLTAGRTGDTTWQYPNYNLSINNNNIIYAQGQDGAGNWGNPASIEVYCDKTAPAVTIDQAITPTKEVLQTIRGGCSFGGPMETTEIIFKVYFNGSASPFINERIPVTAKTWDKEIEFINGDGTYRIEASASDFAGNESAFVTTDIIYDSTRPAGEFSVKSPSGDQNYTNSQAITLCFNNVTEDTVHQVLVRNVPNTDWTPRSYAAEVQWPLLDSINGPKTIEAKLVDDAGNESLTTYSATITLDTTTPEVNDVTINGLSLTAVNPNPAIDPKVINSTPQINITATDNYGIDNYVVEFIRGGQITSFPSGSGSLQIVGASALSDGKYTLKVRVTDRAGNVKELTFENITVAGGDPEITSKIIAAPNPFNPIACEKDPTKTMKIYFTVSGDPQSIIGVYFHDIAGRLAWKRTYTAQELLDKKCVEWDGKTDFGEIAENGVYLVRIVDETNKKLIGKTKIAIVKKEI